MNHMALEIALGQRAALVGAGVGDRVAAAFDAKQRDGGFADLDRKPGVGGNFVFRGHPDARLVCVAHGCKVTPDRKF